MDSDLRLPPAGTRVHVWRNLHLAGRRWSLRCVGDSRVFSRPAEVLLYGVELRVQPAGRDRARREQQRNVHAYLAGTIHTEGPRIDAWTLVTYSPYGEHAAFWEVDTGNPVAVADWVRLDSDGCWVAGQAAF